MTTANVIKLIVFAVLSAGIIAFSWPSLRRPRSHGFWRFFAFEAIVALFLLVVDGWFRSPLAPHQIVSWVLLTVAGVLAVWGFYLLRAIGKPEGSFEDTTVLVKRGLYKVIRHPLYSSLLFLVWGIFFKAPSLVGGALALIVSAALFATAKADEAECIEKFGSAYEDYIKETRMFIPLLF